LSTYTQPAPRRAGSAGAYDTWEEDRRSGWLTFAGVLLMVVGTVNVIEGIAAIGNAHFFVHNTNYVFASLNTWGWIALCIGVVQLLVGLGVFAKNQFARWAGVFILSLNALAQLLMMPAYPLWSLLIFTVDILAIYGLVAYGQHITD
jgi:hypothetical protein